MEDKNIIKMKTTQLKENKNSTHKSMTQKKQDEKLWYWASFRLFMCLLGWAWWFVNRARVVRKLCPNAFECSMTQFSSVSTYDDDSFSALKVLGGVFFRYRAQRAWSWADNLEAIFFKRRRINLGQWLISIQRRFHFISLLDLTVTCAHLRIGFKVSSVTPTAWFKCFHSSHQPEMLWKTFVVLKVDNDRTKYRENRTRREAQQKKNIFSWNLNVKLMWWWLVISSLCSMFAL